jgi:transposase
MTRAEFQTWRRQRAWELSQKGWKQRTIAEALGVSPGAVSQWLKRGREGGSAALQTRPRTGRPPKLRPEQVNQIVEELARGAPAHGFRGDRWTGRRVAEVIQRTAGVRYHPKSAPRLLRQWRWSPQRPIERATQRHEAAIDSWWQETWPALKKRR